MKWLGVLLLCMVASFLLCITHNWNGEGATIKVATFAAIVLILFALVMAVALGITLVM